MTPLQLIKRSLLYYWRTNLGIALGAAVGAAILTGALMIGDSVRGSLRETALSRLGSTQAALASEDRFFRAALAGEIGQELSAVAAPVMQLRGVVSTEGGTARANRVNILGVDERFWRLGDTEDLLAGHSETIVVNRPLAAKLALSVGDNVVLRIERGGYLSRDAPLGAGGDPRAALSARVVAIADEDHFGRFSLRANQVPPLNAFVPLELLSKKAGMAGRANMLLLGGKTAITLPAAQDALKKHWQLPDAGLQMRPLPGGRAIEMRSDRIFIEAPAAQAAASVDPDALAAFTYFVNELRVGDRATPYSMVTALGPLPASPSLEAGGPLPADMGNDEILINSWLANDLNAKAGDTLTLKYFVLGPGRQLTERSRDFTIRGEVPIERLGADRNLMPNFPGLAEIENCRDWKPGIDIKLKRIRKVDEEYWNRYRGTPKAFLTLNAGQQMWGSRFGNLTAVRFDLRNNSRPAVEAAILADMDPASMGLFFQPVRDTALAAGQGATNFAGLFLGLSCFIIVSALLLTGLLFLLGIEQRTSQVGLMLAVGFTGRQTRRIMLAEGAVLAVIGAVLGTIAGTAYTKAMLLSLAGVWSDAVASARITFHATWASMVGGAAAGTAAAVAAMYLALRRQLRRRPAELLSGMDLGLLASVGQVRRPVFGVACAATCGIGAVCVLAFGGWRRGDLSPMMFFTSGGLLLLAGIGLVASLLRWLERSAGVTISLAKLGLRNTTRRRVRSLAVVALLACATFLIVSIGVFRQGPLVGADTRRSGTGGFALYGESTIPIFGDLNSRRRLKLYGLSNEDMDGLDIVQIRMREGDDASCLNLNRPQSPQLLGVPTAELSKRRAFTFAGNTVDSAASEDPWAALERQYGDAVPAIADEATIKWALHTKVGQTLLMKDEGGRPLKLLLVAAVKGSILQGAVLISQERFVQHYPSEGGTRAFLIDASPGSAKNISERLTYALQDYGLELTATTSRLADFNAVQNTYLSIFQMLGGFGLVLGSVGVALVLARNVLERRGELALLRAVGFGKPAIALLILYEHWALLAGGLACGAIAATVAVLPAMLQPGTAIPVASLAMTLAAVVITGVGSALLAALLSLRGRPIEALRNE